MRKRSESDIDDPREKRKVHVSPYEKKDGTEISEHERGQPMARGKFRFQYPGRIKGKVKFYDDEGKKVSAQKINEPLVLDRKSRKAVEQIDEK